MDDSATGTPQLRPMGVTELIDATVTLYRNNFVLFAGVVAVLAIPQTILSMIFVSLLPTTSTINGAATTFTTAAQTYSVAASRGTGTGLVGAVFTVFIMGALAQACAARYLGRSETVVGAYTDTGVGAFARLLLALLLGVVAVVVFVGAVALLTVLAVTVGGGSVPLILLAILLGVLGLVLGSYVTPHLYLVPQVIVLEGRGIVASVRRSWFLVHGSYWHVVGLVFLVELMVGIVSGIIGGVVTLLTLGHPVVATGATGVLGILLQPVSLGAFTLLYFDQRIRREGFDLEYAAGNMALSSR